jgi:hypothetical protein
MLYRNPGISPNEVSTTCGSWWSTCIRARLDLNTNVRFDSAVRSTTPDLNEPPPLLAPPLPQVVLTSLPDPPVEAESATTFSVTAG